MEHTPNISQNKASRWEQLGNDLMTLYQPLEDAMVAIHAQHPQSKFGEINNIDSCDAFQRCVDLVPNVAVYTGMLDFEPDPKTAQALLKKWQPKTDEIMKQTEAMLYEYGASDGTIYLCWKVKEQLDQIYDEAKKQVNPKPHVSAADYAAAGRLGTKNNARKPS